jgi:hypothetical protein
MSQKDAVLDKLRGRWAVCSTTLLEMRIPRGAARIADLRSEGYPILTEPCTNPHHNHRTRQVQYRLHYQSVLF